MSMHRGIVLITIVVGALFFSGIVDRAFSSRGEAREALVAQSILNDGNWILPRGYNNDVPSKPPFMHWIIAGISLLQGDVDELTTRLPSMIFSLAAILALYFYLARRENKETAFIAALILAFSFEWLRNSTTGRVDMCLSAAMVMGFLGFFSFIETKNLFSFPLASIAFSIATLSKGPVAIILPFAICVTYLIVKPGKFSIQSLFQTLGLFTLSFILPFIWYYLAYLQGGNEFTEMVKAENISRFLGDADKEPHTHSALYLYGTVFTGFMPWTVPLLALVLRGVWANRNFRLPLFLEGVRSNQFLLFSITIIFGFIVFYSIPSGKRSVYLLPIYPFLSYIVSVLLLKISANEFKYFSLTLRVFAGVVLGGVLLVLLFSLFSYEDLSSISTKKQILETHLVTKEIVQGWSWIDYLILLSFIFSTCFLWRYKEYSDKKGIFSSIIVFIFCFELFIQFSVVRPYANSISGKRFSQLIAERIEPDAQLYSYRYGFYGMSFYLKRRIFEVEDSGIQANAYILFFEKEYNNLQSVMKDRFRFIQLEKSDRGIEKVGKLALFGKVEETLRP